MYRALFEIAEYGTLGCGIALAAYFCLPWTRQVSRFWTMAAFDAGAWVWLVLLVYVWSFVLLIVTGAGHPTDRGWSGIVVRAVVDVVVAVRVWRWRKINLEIRDALKTASREVKK